MNEQLENLLIQRYPKIFRDANKTPQETPMAFGIECGDGWFSLIDTLCSQLQVMADQGHPQVVAAQVKEKFGSLRFYVDNASEEQYSLINLTEDLSATTCENCGQVEIESGRKASGWVITLCDNCATQTEV